MLFLDLKIGSGITLAGMMRITVGAINAPCVTVRMGNTEEILTVGEERRFGALRVVLKSIAATTARIGFETDSTIALVPHNWP